MLILQKNIIKWGVNGEIEIVLQDTSFKLVSDCDDSIVDWLYYDANAYSEIKEMMLFGKIAERSKFILDIGANTGVYSVFAAVKNRSCRIWAFEPYQSNFERY